MERGWEIAWFFEGDLLGFIDGMAEGGAFGSLSVPSLVSSEQLPTQSTRERQPGKSNTTMRYGTRVVLTATRKR